MTGHPSEEKIALLAGGDLDPQEAPDFNQRVNQCPDCSALLESYRRRRETMADLGAEDASTNDYMLVRSEVLARLQSQNAWHFWSWLSLRWCASAGAILIAASLGYWWLRSAPATRVVKVATPPMTAVVEPRAVPREAPKPSQGIIQNQAASSPPTRRGPAMARKATPAMPLQAASTGRELLPQPTDVPELDDIAIKMETGDPNIIIIWLVSPRGEGR